MQWGGGTKYNERNEGRGTGRDVIRSPKNTERNKGRKTGIRSNARRTVRTVQQTCPCLGLCPRTQTGAGGQASQARGEGRNVIGSPKNTEEQGRDDCDRHQKQCKSRTEKHAPLLRPGQKGKTREGRGEGGALREEGDRASEMERSREDGNRRGARER